MQSAKWRPANLVLLIDGREHSGSVPDASLTFTNFLSEGQTSASLTVHRDTFQRL